MQNDTFLLALQWPRSLGVALDEFRVHVLWPQNPTPLPNTLQIDLVGIYILIFVFSNT